MDNSMFSFKGFVISLMLVAADFALAGESANVSDTGKIQASRGVGGVVAVGVTQKIAAIVEASSPGRMVVADRVMADALAQAGFLPFVLPHVADTNVVRAMVERADALVVFGAMKDDTDERYRFERQLIRQAATRGIPVLGVCNGIQQINQAFGGTIARNPADAAVKVGHGWIGSAWTNDQYHAIEVAPNSLVAAALGAGRQTVNSSHYWSIERLADGFEVTARADDGVIEAIEHRSLPVVGVQFHPERMAVRDGDERALQVVRLALEGRGRMANCCQ